jgi:hypothetical protein
LQPISVTGTPPRLRGITTPGDSPEYPVITALPFLTSKLKSASSFCLYRACAGWRAGQNARKTANMAGNAAFFTARPPLWQYSQEYWKTNAVARNGIWTAAILVLRI